MPAFAASDGQQYKYSRSQRFFPFRCKNNSDKHFSQLSFTVVLISKSQKPLGTRFRYKMSDKDCIVSFFDKKLQIFLKVACYGFPYFYTNEAYPRLTWHAVLLVQFFLQNFRLLHRQPQKL